MPNKVNALFYANENLPKFKLELENLVKMPSISTDTNHVKDIRNTAEWLKSKLSALGFQETKILETDGHPAVYGEYQVDPNAKTVLIYGHYDVQPVDPINLWKTDPFEPTIIEDRMYGRGASDMKGQIIASMAAVESMINSGGSPVNIKYIIEGEEEIGSPNLAKALKKYADLLRCDVILNPDAGMISPTSPTIVYGLRGLAYFEIIVKGPNRDLHSGMFGGVVHNPAIVLSKLIAGMVNEDGVIQLPGYYDSVDDLSPAERAELSRLPISDNDLKEQTGAKKLHGEKGYTSIERLGARPTLDVNGLLSGFTGKGSKTIIPAWAMAKVSMRLVPHQDPKVVHQQLVTYIQNNAPELGGMGSYSACWRPCRNHKSRTRGCKGIK